MNERSGLVRAYGRKIAKRDVEDARTDGVNAQSQLIVQLNRAFTTAQSTTNSQGGGGGGIILLVQLTVKQSGRFRYAGSFSHAGVATDAVTGSIEYQQDAAAGSPTFTNATNTTNGGAPADGQKVYNSGGAGSSIGFGAGFGGGAVVLALDTKTIGTAAAGYSFASSGIFSSGAAVGAHVYLALRVVNAGASRACSAMVLELEELAT